MTQDEKEIVSALGQLAAQLSAGVASGSVEGGIQGAIAGKNAVENNTFSPGHDEEEREKEHGNRPIKILKINPLKLGIVDDEGNVGPAGGKVVWPGTVKGLPATGLSESGKGAKATGSGAKFADQAKLDDHFARHGSDFGAKNTLEYQAQADKFLTASKPAGVLEKARTNGDIVRYNPSTDEFGVVSSGGSIRTYYKPDPAVHGKGSNLDYFNAQ